MMTGMEPQKSDDLSRPAEGEQGTPEEQSAPHVSLLGRTMDALARLGLGEVTVRVGTNVLAIALVVLVVWLMQVFYSQAVSGGTGSALAASGPTATPELSAASLPLPTAESAGGIFRETSLHTSIPSRPRIEVIEYTVQPGDSVFGIAAKFGLNPSTILFGNYAVLKDTPHSLRPGQVLVILPVDGTYYEWNATDTLTGVAEFFGVEPDSIVSYPGNHLDPDAITDYAAPGIAAGTMLIVPGGKREFISWSAPIGVTRDNPAIARVMGAGSCGAISGGAIGYGTYIWPANKHYLSGYDYSPETNHRAIDIAGDTGEAIYATDAGVIVYVGWNDYGYGNLIMIDHGNGWQSLYAHLSAFNVVCGQSVGQGDVIGAFGSTGNSSGSHLHFELMSTTLGKVNPWFYLPPP
ncbi:MAG: peptidase M23 family protein [Anaerolineaceae bacterium]|nr:MAG: peptidase M23 family protein [Anaerolineaceae bacterium]